MIDTWIKNDLERIYEKHPVAVLINPSGELAFLHDFFRKTFTVFTADTELEELHVKYLIERENQPVRKILILTRTPRENLKYIREYCETNDCREIGHLENYIKAMVHQALNLNINLPKTELIAAARVSVGKDLTYWMDLCHKGAGEIFDLEKELLPFLYDPQKYEQEKYDPQLREVFYRKVQELLGQKYIAKPAKTLATEVVNAMLDGLARGACPPKLESVYKNWLDSISYRDSFSGYLAGYKLPKDIDIWKVSPSHPFRQVDQEWLKVIGADIGNKAILPNHLARISRRIQNEQAQTLGITFWADVKTLLAFDPADIAYLSSFAECVDFYTHYFYHLDTAIRNLYTEFLNQPDLLEPFQEHYRQFTAILLDKWFQFFKDYHEDQSGLLQRIIDANPTKKIAIIVGDGIAYEIASLVAEKVNGGYPITKRIILADLPSETENNMSRVYMDNGVTESVHANREKYLLEHNSKTTIEFINLDDVSDEASPAQVLICTSKDIDDLGGKLKQKALKYFPEAINIYSTKIVQLLNSGVERVYLITDHGFVLTGLLSEADKITVHTIGETKKAERYLRTTESQSADGEQWVELHKKYDTYKYLYVSRTMNPFKTPGVYGYAHGGASPQELITPYFFWECSKDNSNTLDVHIQNKASLVSITGEIFPITLQAGKGSGDFFSFERKVILVFFSGQIQVNKSDIITIQNEQSVTKEYSFDGREELVVLLLDASTKEQLDRVEIKQKKDRDLGGLF